MKRYIHASENRQIFDESRTGMSYYDDFLNEEDLKYKQKAKNLTGHIEMLSPNEYFQICADDIFHIPVEQIKEGREYSKSKQGGRLIDEYAQKMEDGVQFPLCFINYAERSQEGLHRMYAAGEAFGWDTKFPVLIVEPYDKEKWNKAQRQGEIDDYAKYTLEDLVEEAGRELADWDEPMPESFTNDIASLIHKKALQEDEPHDIKVKVDITKEQVVISLTEYDGEEVESGYETRLWIKDLFKVEE